ncbi:hypothetical protein J6590_045089 [Homalodisca vitripennis]|nr:hypothetical protein J6590_045089 [Homalodisca vitripennis]
MAAFKTMRALNCVILEEWIKKEAYPTKEVQKFYTDGSRLVSRAGFGIYGLGVNLAVPLGKHATVFLEFKLYTAVY